MAKYEVQTLGMFIADGQSEMLLTVEAFAEQVYLTPEAMLRTHYLVLPFGRKLEDILENLPRPTTFTGPLFTRGFVALDKLWAREKRQSADTIFGMLVNTKQISCWLLKRKLLSR